MGALSDGYVTTARWIIDLVARWAEEAAIDGHPPDGSFNTRMTGLVLIDELDVHLHPRWQTEVVQTLRRLFPLLSFVATTHNPLTLLGTEAGEVHVLRRDEVTGGVEIRQVDVPKGMRTDQVLTGEWFGLPSTVDNETLALLDRHRELLRAEVPSDDPQRQQLEAQLRERLGSVADTSIERLALSAAAQVMSEDYRKLGPDDRKAIREKVLERLS